MNRVYSRLYLSIATLVFCGVMLAACTAPSYSSIPTDSVTELIVTTVDPYTPEITVVETQAPTETVVPTEAPIEMSAASYQEYFNQAIGISSTKIKLEKVEVVSESVIEVYDSEGNLMIVSENGVNRLAPFGLSLQPGSNIWQQWQGADGWKNLYELDDYPELHRQLAEYVQTHLIEPISSDKNETMYGAGEGFTFHTRVNPEKANEIYQAFLDAMSQPEYTEAKKYWQSIGVNNGEQLLNYLRNNIGGPENKPYWLPAEINGNPLYLVVGHENANSGDGQYRKFIEQGAGLYLDQIQLVAFSFADYQNPFVKGYIQYIREMNPYRVLIAYGPQGSQWSCWGLAVNPFTGRLMFIVGNPEYSDSILKLDKRSLGIRYLGGKDYLFDPEDVMKIEAYMKAYLLAYDLRVSNGTPPGGTNERIVIDGANFGSPYEDSVSSYQTDNWLESNSQ